MRPGIGDTIERAPGRGRRDRLVAHPTRPRIDRSTPARRRPFTWTIRSPFDPPIDGDFVAAPGPPRRSRRRRRADQQRPPLSYSSDVHAQYPAVECHFPLRSVPPDLDRPPPPADFQLARHPRRPSRRARPFHVRAVAHTRRSDAVRAPAVRRASAEAERTGPTSVWRAGPVSSTATRSPPRRCTPQWPRPLRGTDRRRQSPRRRVAARARPEIRCGSPPRRTRLPQHPVEEREAGPDAPYLVFHAAHAA